MSQTDTRRFHRAGRYAQRAMCHPREMHNPAVAITGSCRLVKALLNS
jgi:hypothetical protein